jgi:hypothetical protein
MTFEGPPRDLQLRAQLRPVAAHHREPRT